MLHGVVNNSGDWAPSLHTIAGKVFDNNVQLLSKHYNFITLNEAINILQGEPCLKKNLAVLTFDDGYRNFQMCALPILKKYSLPASIYVVTDNTNRGKYFWYDELDYLLQHYKGKSYEIIIQGRSYPLLINTYKEFKKTYSAVRKKIKRDVKDDYKLSEHINRVIDDLKSQSGFEDTNDGKADSNISILDWQELKILNDEDLVEIGSHTVNHIRLAYVDSDSIYNELYESKREIERQLSLSCDVVCYPNGSFNDEVCQLSKKAGFIAGLTTVTGFNSVNDDLFRLKRIAFPVTDNKLRVMACATGLYYYRDKLKNLFKISNKRVNF